MLQTEVVVSQLECRWSLEVFRVEGVGLILDHRRRLVLVWSQGEFRGQLGRDWSVSLELEQLRQGQLLVPKEVVHH